MAVPLTLKLIAKTAGFQKSLLAAEKSFNKTTKKFLGDSQAFRKIGTEFKTIGTKITIGLGVPIGAAAFAVLKAAGNFEEAFIGVKKTVNATQTEFNQLEADIKAMAKELPFSAIEIANVAEKAGQLGLKAPEIAAFTKVVLDFSTSTNIAAGDAAISLARLSEISGIGTENISNLASAIVALGNDIKGDELEIIETTLNFAAMGKEIGLTAAQIVAFGASVVESGAKSEAGGTAISELFRRVAISVAESGAELNSIAEISGTTAVAFKKSFEEDANTAIRTLLEGISKIPGAAGDTLIAMGEIDFTGRRLGGTILALADQFANVKKNSDLATKEFALNSASTIEAEKRYASFNSQVDILKGRLNLAAVEMGENLLPIFDKFSKEVIVPLIEKISDLAKEFSKLSPDDKEFFVELAAALVLSGPILVGLGFMISSIQAIGTAALFVFWGPLGIIAAIVALTFWLLKATGGWEAFSKQADDTTKKLEKSIETHGFFTTVLATLVKNLAGSAVEYESVAETIDLATDAAIEMGGAAVDSIAEFLGFSSELETLKKESGKFFDSVVDGSKDMIDSFKEKKEAIIALSREELVELTKIEKARVAMLAASEKAEGDVSIAQNKAIKQQIFDALKKFVEDKATLRIKEQDARRLTEAELIIILQKTAQAEVDANKEANDKILEEDAEFDVTRKENAESIKTLLISLSSDISTAIVDGLDDPKEAWKNFARKTIEVLVQMAIEAILKAQVISIAMASATIGISLVTALLASLFGGSGSKQSKSKLQSATKSFLDNIKETLIEFESEILSVFDSLGATAIKTDAALAAINKGIEDVAKFVPKGNKTPGLVGLAITGFNFTDLGAQVVARLFGHKRKKSKAEKALNRLKSIIVANADLALQGIKEEARIKKKAINEIFSLIQKERNFIKDIDRTITGVRRAFFSDKELFSEQKKDITNLTKLVALATGEEKLALSKELKDALLASFDTAKNLFNIDNSAEIQRLKDERLATIETAGPGADARATAITDKIQMLTDQQKTAKADLDLWQSSVITGLESVKSSGQSAFTQLFLEQVKLVKVTVAQARDVASMNIALKSIQDSSVAAITTLQLIGTQGATTALVSQLANDIFALRGNPIPMLAQGGIVNRPTQAIIGESGPEAIIPLSKLGGGQTTINVTLNVKDAASLSTTKWEQILKENLGTAMERINRQGFRSSLQPKAVI